MITPNNYPISLRYVNEEDADFVCRLRNTPAVAQGFFNSNPITPADHISFLQAKSPNDHIWVIEDTTDTPIGMCSLTIKGNSAEHGRSSLLPEYQGKGYAQAQLLLCLHIAFDQWGLDVVWAEVKAHNEAMLYPVLKVGFELVGVNLPGHSREGVNVAYIEYPVEKWCLSGRVKWADKYNLCANLPIGV